MSRPLDPDTVETLAADYVLGALSDVERAAFERRLAAEPVLAAEVRRLRATFDLMPFAAVAAPPAELRARVLAAAEMRARRTVAPARPPRRLVWSRFAAAAAAALALAFGVDAWNTRHRLALERELTATLEAPNVVHTFRLAGAGGAHGRVALDLDAKKGAVVLKGMPELPAGQVYRLWARVLDSNVPCGDFRAAPDGTLVAQFAVPVESYKGPVAELFVTVEPAGAGDRPTGKRVLEGA
jgi:anti-sigma-K factor RskA